MNNTNELTESGQQPQQQYQQQTLFTHAPQTKKGISPWGIAGIAAGVLSFFLICAVICSIAFLGLFSDENLFGSDRSEIIAEFLYDADDIDFSPDPAAIAQINSEFFDADVDIVDSSRETVSPAVYRNENESIFIDDFFNIAIVVPDDIFQEDLRELSVSYAWHGFSESDDHSVSISRLEGFGGLRLRSSQDEVKRTAVASWRNSTIVESGVITISGEEYIFVRYYGADQPDVHFLKIGRSLNGVQFTAHWFIFDPSRSTESFFE